MELQRQKREIIFQYCNVIMNLIIIVKNTEDDWDKILTQLKQTVDKILYNIKVLTNLKGMIIEINGFCKNIQEKDIPELENKLNEYNKTESIDYLKVLNNTNENEEFIKQLLEKIKKMLEKNDNIKVLKKAENTKKDEILNDTEEFEKEQQQESIITKDKNSNDNNILLISEIEGKVFLPYKIKDLEEEIKNKSKYKTIEELIAKEYIIDLLQFKNTITARFRESYNLIKNKENGSIFDAVQLGLELMLNYSLHPAIIAACKNEDELDIYLDCLEENELDMFNIFEIKYEIAPVLKKK